MKGGVKEAVVVLVGGCLGGWKGGKGAEGGGRGRSPGPYHPVELPLCKKSVNLIDLLKHFRTSI